MSISFRNSQEHRDYEIAFDNLGTKNKRSLKEKRDTLSGTGRILAIDVIRGLAVIGMFIQHFASNDRNASLVSGNTTILFILCGGISYSIMAKRMMTNGGGVGEFRARMLARSVFIDIIGYFLIMLNTPYGIILPAYAGLFVMGLVLIHRSMFALVLTFVISLLICPPIMIIGNSVFSNAFLLSDIAGGPMSAVALAPAFFAGMIIGQIELSKSRNMLMLASGGIIILVFSSILDATILPVLNHSFEQWLVSKQANVTTNVDPYAIWPLNLEMPMMWHTLFWTVPHSASTFQTLLGLGISFLVLGIVGIVPKRVSFLLKPFAAVGRIALTMYVAQFIIVWVLELVGINYSFGTILYGDLMIVIITLIMGSIIARFHAAPLENLMRKFDRFFSKSVDSSITENHKIKS